MKSIITTSEKTTVNISDEIMGFSLKVGAVIGTVIGIWAMACLVAGLINSGPTGLVKGYITAITGI
ncbi:hypothetical protein [Desulfomarina sp.]